MSETTTSGEPPAEATTTDTPRAEDFALQLPVFEGPLELLLHLIEREELDITEVSLVAVTEQYLGHLSRRDHIDLGAIAAFISVGARLLLLKSRALLPRDEEEAADEDEERDPEALLEALREYRRYRAAAEHLRDLEDEHRTAYRREVAPPQAPPGLASTASRRTCCMRCSVRSSNACRRRSRRPSWRVNRSGSPTGCSALSRGSRAAAPCASAT